MLSSKEKRLYHQIHPAKLLTDISTSIITTYLLWYHNILWFLILFLVPSVIVTLLLMNFTDLQWLRESAMGKYIAKYMTSTIEAVRFLGQFVVWIGAWYHMAVLIPLGFLIIIAAWCNGLIRQ